METDRLECDSPSLWARLHPFPHVSMGEMMYFLFLMMWTLNEVMCGNDPAHNRYPIAVHPLPFWEGLPCLDTSRLSGGFTSGGSGLLEVLTHLLTKGFPGYFLCFWVVRSYR